MDRPKPKLAETGTPVKPTPEEIRRAVHALIGVVRWAAWRWDGAPLVTIERKDAA